MENCTADGNNDSDNDSDNEESEFGIFGSKPIRMGYFMLAQKIPEKPKILIRNPKSEISSCIFSDL